jgi:hypothetical protein
VFYELGLAHASQKPVVLVAGSIEDIPFDLRSLRVIVYNKDRPDWGRTLRQSITGAIREVLSAPLAAVLPSFLDVRGAQKKRVTPAQKDLLEIKQDLDLMKREISHRAPVPEPVKDDGRLSAVSARALIGELVGAGARNTAIQRALTNKGAPASWVTDVIAEERKKLKPRRTRRRSRKRPVSEPGTPEGGAADGSRGKR